MTKANTNPPEFRCTCKNVTMGSYDNQVTVDIPPHMSTYKEIRLSVGLSDVVSIDRCILETVQYLWSLGIRTIGSCCGHGDQKLAYVAVVDADVPAMESLGLRTVPSENAYVFHIRERIPESAWKRLARKLYRELSVCPSCDGGGYTETRIRDSQGYDIDCDIDECRHCMGYGDSHTAAVKRQSNKLRAERDQLKAENELLREHLRVSEEQNVFMNNSHIEEQSRLQACFGDVDPCEFVERQQAEGIQSRKRAEAWKLAAEFISEGHFSPGGREYWKAFDDRLKAARALDQEGAQKNTESATVQESLRVEEPDWAEASEGLQALQDHIDEQEGGDS